MQEREAVIKDSAPGLTPAQKNKELAARLAVGPWVNRLIVKIERLEIAVSGWKIYYRTT